MKEIRNKEIYKEFITGLYTLKQLAEKFNIDQSSISRILTEKIKKP